MADETSNDTKIATLKSLEYLFYNKIKPLIVEKGEFNAASFTDIENADTYETVVDEYNGVDPVQKVVTPAMVRYAAELYGGGGNQDISAPVISVPEAYETGDIVVDAGSSFFVPVTFETPNKGKGTLVWTLSYASNNVSVDSGTQSILGTQNLTIPISKSGAYKLSMYAYDRTYGNGGLESNVIEISILYGALSISSLFRNNSTFELPKVGSSTSFDIPVSISCLVSDPGNDQKIELTCSITRSGSTTPTVLTGEVAYATSTNYTFTPTISTTADIFNRAGVYKISIAAKFAKDADGTSYYDSNTLNYSVLVEDGESLLITTDYSGNVIEAVQYDKLNVSYTISMKNQTKFTVVGKIDGEETLNASVYIGTNLWSINTDNLSVGNHTITIEVTTTDTSIDPVTESITLTLVLAQSDFQKIFPLDDSSLVARYNFSGLNNTDSTRETLSNLKNPGTYDGTLHGFNFITNGYDGEKLICNGAAYVSIPYPVFSSNCIYGCTVDVLFNTRDIGNTAAKVIECANYVTTSTGTKLIGLSIDTLTASFGSLTQTLNANILNDTDIRVTFVIDRENSKFFIYINGEIAHMLKLSDQLTGSEVTSTYESFEHDNYIILNGHRSTNESTEVTDHGSCEFKEILIYKRALSYSEVVNNFISGLSIVDQQKEYNKNYNNEISTMYFRYKKSEEDYMHAAKSNKISADIRFIPKSALHGAAIDETGCEIKMQGTSSLQYPIKNYNFTLKRAGSKIKWAIRPGSIEESKLCLKCDYMSPEHANNTGIARFLNDGYALVTGSDGNPLQTPPQKYVDSNIRVSIDGYPIQLYKELTDDDGNVIETKWVGVYNLNNDKDNPKTFGLFNDAKITQGQGRECKAMRFEVTANSDVSAGAFVKYENNATAVESMTKMEYYQTDFELNYPSTDDLTDTEIDSYYENLIAAIEFVNDADDETFKNELGNHFNVDFLLYYYCATIMLGAVDNLGKNMMLSSWDGVIFYPTFYDVDTILSLNNSGEIKFDVDIELDSENVFNTSKSNLWVKLRRVFAAEISEMYIKMRKAFFNEETFKKYYYTDQIGTIGALLYNRDAEAKYFDYPTYYSISRCSRWTHTYRWFKERLLFCDTLFGYDAQVGKSITIRVNMDQQSDGSIKAVSFPISTYSPMYVKIKFSNNANGIVTKKVGRNEVSTITGQVTTTTDQEVIIYNAEYLKDIGDLTDKKISRALLENAPRLTKFVCHDSPNLAEVSIPEDNQFMQEVDLQGCIGISGKFDVSSITNLKKVNLLGTNVTELLVNSEGGNLEEIYYPYTILSINLTNQYNLVYAIVPYDSTNGLGADVYSVNLFNNPNLESIYTTSSYERKNLAPIARASIVSIVDCPKLVDEDVSYNINTNPIEYGVRWNAEPMQSSPKYERVMIIHGVNSSGEFTKEYPRYGFETNLIANAGEGSQTVDNSFDNISPWKDIKDATVSGRSMVSIPVNWFLKREIVDGMGYLMITTDSSIAALKGYHRPRKFLKKDNTVVNGFYVGKYKTSGENGNQSGSGCIPTVNKTRAWYRKAARGIGEGWHITDLQYLYEVLVPLFLIEFATTNTQSIMRGHSQWRYSMKALITKSSSTIQYVENFVKPPEGDWWYITSGWDRFTAYERIAIIANSDGEYLEENVVAVSDVSDSLSDYSGNTDEDKFDNYINAIYNDVANPPKFGYKLTFLDSASFTAGSSYNYDAVDLCGSTDSVVASSGSATSNTTGKSSCKYRGIENFFGDVWEFVDGVNIKANQSYVCEDIDLYDDDTWTEGPTETIETEYADLTELKNAMNNGLLEEGKYYLAKYTMKYYLYGGGTTLTDKGKFSYGGYYALSYKNSTSDGYVRTMGYDDKFPWARLPSKSDGSSSTYFCDNYWQSSGSCLVRVGGYWANGQHNGLFSLHCSYSSSATTLDSGSRLLLIS